MKLKEFIKKLQRFDPELIVCLNDWSEEYVMPSESAAEDISIVQRKYLTKDKMRINGKFILIGCK